MAEPTTADDRITLSLRPAQGGGDDHAPRRCYLLVFEAGTSWTFALPTAGEVRIGRSAEVELRLADESTSRLHARLIVGDAGVQVEDLDSYNGTRVNGEPVSVARLLASGDVLSICGATLVLHTDVVAPSTRAIGELTQLRHRMEEELERARLYQRVLALVVVRFDGALADRPRVAAALAGQLRLIDVAGWGGATELLLVLPELDEKQTAHVARRLLAALAPVASARIGFALAPADGDDADTLILAARSASASGREIPAPAGATQSTFTLGGREIVVADPAMRAVYALARKLAATELPVLIQGESGVGKESVAAALHEWSRRAGRPWVVQNCAALPETLVESLLFGHAKGAFSGAVTARVGLLESASGGTLFLDEIGELALVSQAKLLRAIDAQRVQRLGEVQERPIDVRLVTATNRRLDEEVAAGRFRLDLLYRLDQARISIPPLRDRRLDLPALARALLTDACARVPRPPMPISSGAMQVILRHRWPGNVRELLGVMGTVAGTAEGAVVEPWHLPEKLVAATCGLDVVATAEGASDGAASDAEADASGEVAPIGTTPLFRAIDEEVRELERRRMAEALRATGGKRRKAAELIRMPLRTFVTKLALYGLGGPGGKSPGEPE